MAHAPAVMLSSTFFDLKQLRKDLASFLTDDLGFQALLSEMPSFPIDPTLDTIANCTKRVQDNADIMVLVVGGRYGSIDDRTSKSVTNLEYLAAREKGIPIYVFVEARILALLDTWKRNPDADYSNVVDTTELFRFVEMIRSEQRVWVHPFEYAQDIIEILRQQFASLLLTSMRLTWRLQGVGSPRYLEAVGPATLRIVLEKPEAWEFKLLFQAWQEEVEQCSFRLRDHRAGIALGMSEYVSTDQAVDWVRTRLHELSSLVEALNKLIQVEIQTGLGAPGEPGDPEHILYVAKRVGGALSLALDWAQRVRLANVDEPFDRIAAEMSRVADDVIDQLVTFPAENLRIIEDALKRASTDGLQKLTFKLTIRLNNAEALNDAIEHVRRMSTR